MVREEETATKLLRGTQIEIRTPQELEKVFSLLKKQGWRYGLDGRTEPVPAMYDRIKQYGGIRIYLHVSSKVLGWDRITIVTHPEYKVLQAADVLGSSNDGQQKKIGHWNTSCSRCGSPAYESCFFCECSDPSCPGK
jgi:hypothetical protein